MNIKFINLILLLGFINSKKIIYFPSCLRCVHYKSSTIYYVNSISRCRQFATKNMTSDKMTYESSESCRNDMYKCGLDGKFFEEKKTLY